MSLSLDGKALFEEQRYSQQPLMDMIMPPSVFPLVLILLLVSPLALLTAESLLVPLFDSVRSIFFPSLIRSSQELPWQFYFKLSVFFVLSFLGVVQLLFRIKTIYYAVWSKAYPRPHELHVDYLPERDLSMLSLLSWSMYRMFVIFLPPIAIGSVTILVGASGFYLLNVILDMTTFTMMIVFISGLFFLMVLTLFSAFAILNSFWSYTTTIFGDVIAITEADLSVKSIYDRSRRVALSTAWGWLFYPLYFGFTVLVVSALTMLWVHMDIIDLISFQADVVKLFIGEIIVLAAYLGIGALKFYTYHQALSNYYSRLPEQFKDRFVPPGRVDPYA